MLEKLRATKNKIYMWVDSEQCLKVNAKMSSVVPDAKLSNCLSFRKICGSTLNIINNLRIRKIFAKWDLRRIDEYIHDFFHIHLYFSKVSMSF